MAVQTRHFQLLIHKLELRKTQRCRSCFPACACTAAILTPISGQTSGILVTEHNLWGHDPFLLCCRALRHPHRKVQCLFCHEGGVQAASFYLPPIKGITWWNFLPSSSWKVRFPTQPRGPLMYSFTLMESNFFQK